MPTLIQQTLVGGMSGVERADLAPGFSVSRILTGLWQVADMERDGKALDHDAAAESMGQYVASGLTTFDMADHYGSAEEIAGRFRQSRGSGNAQFLTKWVPEPGPMDRETVRRAVRRSLERLKTDTIDLLQFHAWVYSDPTWLDGLLFLQELKEEGLIRHLGVTNVDSAHLRVMRSSGVDVVSNQVCYSLLDQRASGAMASVCEECDVKLIAFGTVAGGFLTERWLDKPEPQMEDLPTWSMMKYKRFIDTAGGWNRFQDLLRVVRDVAAKHNVSMANVACRYILEQPAVAGVIIGARLGESQHIDDNMRIMSFSLDADSKQALQETMEALDPIPGDCGDEYRRPPFLTASGDLSHHVTSFPAPYPAQQGADGRTRALSGTIWEDLAGFSRALRIGDRILVSGTTATHGDLLVGGSDPAAQMHFVIDKVEGAIVSLGGKLEDVVRTRIYIQNEDDWEPISRVHGQRFGAIQPANTLVKATLIGDGYLVEMEAEAVVQSLGGTS